MSINLFIGIDPGSCGGIAFKDGDHIEAFSFERMTERDIMDIIVEKTLSVNAFCYLERAQPLPSKMRGGIASFKLGHSYGFLRGILAGLKIPFDTVTPQAWQKALGCLTRGDKNVSKEAAQRLFPGVKVTHATADALLIAYYGYTKERTAISPGNRETNKS